TRSRPRPRPRRRPPRRRPPRRRRPRRAPPAAPRPEPPLRPEPSLPGPCRRPTAGSSAFPRAGTGSRGLSPPASLLVSANADIGVIGGSGFYSFLEDVTEVRVDTPYGAPSDSLFLGEIAGRRVAFLPRHGRGHHLPPHRINYRANLWALRSVGVRQVL